MSKYQSGAQSGATLVSLGALVIGLALAEPVGALPFTWNPGAVGLNGATPFTGDALKLSEYSHTKVVSPTTWSEHGYLQVTGIVNNNAVSVPTGLNSDYSLYLDYENTGTIYTGKFDTLSMTLYGVEGVSSFDLDGNLDAYVNNAGTPIQLATLEFDSGFVGGIPGVTAVIAEMELTFLADPNALSVFLAPLDSQTIKGNFFHPGVFAAVFGPDGGLTDFAFKGGDNTLSFVQAGGEAGPVDAVPEPGAMLLWAGGWSTLLHFPRRRAAA